MPVIYLNYKYITICTAITICKPNFAKIWANISNQNISTVVMIVGFVMIGIGWYKRAKSDKAVFKYMEEYGQE